MICPTNNILPNQNEYVQHSVGRIARLEHMKRIQGSSISETATFQPVERDFEKYYFRKTIFSENRTNHWNINTFRLGQLKYMTSGINRNIRNANTSLTFSTNPGLHLWRISRNEYSEIMHSLKASQKPSHQVTFPVSKHWEFIYFELE